MPTLSLRFKAALKLADEPAYRIAHAANVHPSWLSQAIHGAIKVKPDDPRLLKIGRRLGLRPEEIFEADR